MCMCVCVCVKSLLPGCSLPLLVDRVQCVCGLYQVVLYTEE